MKFIELVVNNKTFLVKAERVKDKIWFHLNGNIFTISKNNIGGVIGGGKPPPITPPSVKKKPASRVKAPMPGKVVKVQVQLNQAVEENQSLLILSSMKMEYFIKSEKKGVIKSIHVKEGDNVSVEQILIEIN